MAGTKPTEVPLALEKEGAKLWKDAYADLKDKDPRRLAYYEEIVSQRILLGAPGLPRSLLTSLTDIFGDMDSSPLIYKAFLAKITNLFVFGQGYDEYYAKPVDSTYQTMNTGAEKVKAAIIPWAATDSSAYVSAGNPLTNSVDTTGCSYILQRLPQYGILPELIFSASTHDSKYSRSLRKGITNLYQSILAFHVQFVFHASGHTPIVYQDEHISIPDTSSSFRAVIEAERTLMGDCTSDMKVQIHQILKDIPQPEHTPNNDGSVVAIDTLHGGSSEGPAVTWEKQDRMDGTVAEYQNFTGPRESSRPLDDQKNRSHATILSTASRNVSLGGAVPVTMAADEQMLGLFYSWVTSTKEYSSVFRQREKKNRVLCVTGTLGSGKSLLMLSIAHRISRGESKPKGLKYCSYFFCSRSFPNCNSFSSVLNGLINMLVKDQILLQKHLEAQRNLVRQGELIILDDFLVLSNILSSILRDKNFNPTVFLVDGVDKLSSEELDKLLRVIRITARISKRITWIISATLQHDCSAPLPWLGKLPRHSNLVWNASQRRLVTAFEDHYIPNKIDELVPGAYLTEDLRNSLINMIRDRACGNFLWAEIACLTARETGPRHTLDSLANIPDKGDIHELYKYLETRLLEPNTETRRLYRQILAYAAVAFKPLKIYELRGFLELSPETDLCSIVYGPLSTFLRVDSKFVSFFDSSARDFIIDRDCMGMGVSSTHAIIAHSCLRLLAEFFQAHETPQSPETVSYAASYWIKHFCEATDIQRSTKAAVEFLAEYSLEWLDLLSSTGKQLELFNLLRDLEKVSMERDLSESSELNSNLLIRVRETHRLYCFHQSMSSPAQPQAKNSLLFYPLGNDIKQKLFAKNLSDIKILPTIRNNRSSLINKLQGHSGDVSACCYSPDGKLVASGSSDDKIHIWDAYTGTIQNIIDTKMPEEWINIVSLAANGHLAATNGSVIKVWNILDSNAYEVFSTTTNYCEGVYDIQLSKNGMKLAATIFGHVKMWNTTRPAAREWDLNIGSDVDIYAHDEIFFIKFCSHDSQLLTASNSLMALWDIEKRQELWNECTLDKISALAVSPNSTSFAVSFDKYVSIFDIKSGQKIRTIRHDYIVIRCAISASPDGLQLACALESGTIKVWRSLSAAGDLIPETEPETRTHDDFIHDLTFSPDGKHILSCAGDETACIWDSSYQMGCEMSTPSLGIGSDRTEVQPHKESIETVACSDNGKFIASATCDGVICSWNGATGRLLHQMLGHDGYVFSLAFHPRDEKILASSSLDCSVRLWDVEHGSNLQVFLGYAGWVRCAVFSHDGELLVSGCDDETIHNWRIPDTKTILNGAAINVETHRGCDQGIRGDNENKKTVLRGQDDIVLCAAFSDDDRYLASGGKNNGSVILWTCSKESNTSDLPRFEIKHRLEGHEGAVLTIVFEPSGQRVFSSCEDKKVRIWDIHTGQCLSFHTAPTVPLRELRMDSMYPDCLFTEFGPLHLGGPSSSLQPCFIPASWPYGVGIYGSGASTEYWITRNNKKHIYIPKWHIPWNTWAAAGPGVAPLLSGVAVCVQGRKVVIGCHSGEVLVFGFK